MVYMREMVCLLAFLTGFYIGLTEKRGFLFVMLKCGIVGVAAHILQEVLAR